MGRNKPRHEIKQDGTKTSDYCQHCGKFDCNPMLSFGTIAERKFTHRFENGLCKGCGKKDCRCKNKKGY